MNELQRKRDKENQLAQELDAMLEDKEYQLAIKERAEKISKLPLSKKIAEKTLIQGDINDMFNEEFEVKGAVTYPSYYFLFRLIQGILALIVTMYGLIMNQHGVTVLPAVSVVVMLIVMVRLYIVSKDVARLRVLEGKDMVVPKLRLDQFFIGMAALMGLAPLVI